MSDTATVRPHLLRWFERRRVVFWHDPDGQYVAELDGLDLPGSRDNPRRQRRVRRQEPAAARRAGQQVPRLPVWCGRRAGVGNWLLDLELAYGVFTADRTALVVQDLGLTGNGIDEVVQAHEKFFNATKRVQSLQALLNPDDDATTCGRR